MYLRFVKFMKLPNVLFSSLIITIADFLLFTFLYGLLRKVSVNKKALFNAFKKRSYFAREYFLMIHRMSVFFPLEDPLFGFHRQEKSRFSARKITYDSIDCTACHVLDVFLFFLTSVGAVCHV